MLSLGASLGAQSIEINARSSRESAPLDEPFNLVYTLNIDGKFNSPNLSGLKLLSGPARGTQSSITIVNGKYSQKLIVTYTFLVRGKKEGQVTIPPASLMVDGKTYKSNSIVVNITKAAGDVPVDEGNVNSGQNKYAFLQISLNKTKLTEGEPVLAVYKLYTIFNSNSPDELKFGAQPGCWIQEIKPSSNGWPPSTQTVGGRRYNVFVLKKEILIPQKSGKIQLEGFDLGMISQVGFMESRRFDMTSNSPVLDVTPLPSPKPDGFTGAVGAFSLNTKISTEELKVNEPIDLIISLEGTGNIKLCELPKPSFPADFETYDPETEEKISVTESGMSGKKELKYLLIPRHAGKFTIPKTAFSYYDMEKNKYVTLYVPEFNINVKKEDGTEVQGNSSTAEKNTVKTLDKDIRYIKDIDEDNLHATGFTGTAMYYVTLGGIPVLLLLLMFIPKKSAEETDRKKNQYTISREITTLLREADTALVQGNKTLFYDKTAQALQLQLLKKTGIQAVQLTHAELANELVKKGVDDVIAREAAQLFETFEMARYATLTAADERAVLQRTEKVIVELNRYSV